MMRFFWMTFLPLSAAGGAAALLLWLARPALRRFAHIQWSVPVLTAALCLFVLPLPVVCDARRVECSRAGGAKLCGDGSARRGGCIGTAVRYDGTAHGGRTSCFALRRRNIYPCCGGWSRRFGWQEYCV